MMACAAGVIALVLAAAPPPPARAAPPSPSARPSPRAVEDRDCALALARKALATAAAKAGVELVVREDQTVEKAFGWVFFAAPREVVTGGAPPALPGLGPLVVHRADGTTRFLSTSVPPDKAIAEYEKQWLRRQRRRP
jgi:hypothetical protein